MLFIRDIKYRYSQYNCAIIASRFTNILRYLITNSENSERERERYPPPPVHSPH